MHTRASHRSCLLSDVVEVVLAVVGFSEELLNSRKAAQHTNCTCCVGVLVAAHLSMGCKSHRYSKRHVRCPELGDTTLSPALSELSNLPCLDAPQPSTPLPLVSPQIRLFPLHLGWSSFPAAWILNERSFTLVVRMFHYAMVFVSCGESGTIFIAMRFLMLSCSQMLCKLQSYNGSPSTAVIRRVPISSPA